MNGKGTYEYLRQEFPQVLSHNLMEKGPISFVIVINLIDCVDLMKYLNRICWKKLIWFTAV